jgi:hypothetical protein
MSQPPTIAINCHDTRINAGMVSNNPRLAFIQLRALDDEDIPLLSAHMGATAWRDLAEVATAIADRLEHNEAVYAWMHTILWGNPGLPSNRGQVTKKELSVP